MTPRIKFDCYHCHCRLRTSIKHVGCSFCCPACQKPLIVPARILDEEEPRIVHESDENTVTAPV